MASGRLQFDSIVYSYEFEYKPDNDAIETAAKSRHAKHPYLTLVECERMEGEIARSKFNSECRKKINNAIHAIRKAFNAARTDVGISQRLSKEVDVKKIAEENGLTLKAEGPVGGPDKSGVIPDEEAAKYPDHLASTINNQLQAEWEERAKRGNRAKKIVDLAIPKPREGQSTDLKFHELAYYLSGFGDNESQFSQEMVALDRFSKSMVTPTRELTGYTFITRPHLNLSNSNLAAVQSMAPLLYADDKSVQMAIRMLLDTNFSAMNGGKINCPYINPNNPFLVPLCNKLRAINGFPDPSLTIETTEGGFFSEQQSCVVGYDRMAKGQDLQITFEELPGGVIMALHDFWTQYMGYISDGTMSQYYPDIEANLMGYTVSIYRFITDSSGRQITRWAKATGCFPKNVPTGSVFNVNQGEKVVTAAREFSAPWWAHHFTYNQPVVLSEFNKLVERYNPWIKYDTSDPNMPGKGDESVPFHQLSSNITNNHCGIPYIIQHNGFTELAWRYKPDIDGRKRLTEDKDKIELTDSEKRHRDAFYGPDGSGGSLAKSLVFPYKR